MPTLDWIGKVAVLNHHREVPIRLLEVDAGLSYGGEQQSNLVVEGDNLEALRALLPEYAGRVKCIYIDPPYNTGVDERGSEGKRAGWVYDDNVNAPEIREWLHRVVGDELQDLSRHDKWLCMMYPRLALLRRFLRSDGVLFVSIDDTEYGNLRMLLDELFGNRNRVGTIVWHNATDNNPTNIAVEHEYVLCYARDKRRLPPEWKAQTLSVKQVLLELGSDFIDRFPDPAARQLEYTKWFRENKAHLWPFDRYKFIDEGGIYTGSQSVHNPGKEGYRYDVLHPVTGIPCVQPLMGYRFPEETMKNLIAEDRILFGENENKIIELKVYVKDYRAKLSSVFELDGRVGTNELKEIFPENRRPFDFPKPTELIAELLSFATTGDDIVLDSFAGSGTTGHAVVKLNAADSQRRRFILVEMKPDIARGITSERLRRVMHGYRNAKDEHVAGLGGGFRYCRVGSELFDEDGVIAKHTTFEELASVVYLAETGEALSERPTAPLVGVHSAKAIYLLYNGVLGDRRRGAGNVLTSSVLAALPPHDGPKIIYGEGCRVGSARLEREGITFKQTPYDVKVG
jgi:adenine-specific DNA-methyltransferase